MMDKVITEGRTAYVFPYSGTGHDINGKQYDFYDNLFGLLNISEYNYYGEQRRLPETYAEIPSYCFYCVPGVWINGNLEPNKDFGVPFYGDTTVFSELLTPCLDTGILLPPRFHALAQEEPNAVYEYDFPCVLYNGHLSNSVHLAPYIDSMQIGHELYIKRYKMGLPVYSAVQTGDFMPLLRIKLENGFTSVCIYAEHVPKELCFPCYDLGDGYYILFFPENMCRDEMGYTIPGIGLGEICIKYTHIVPNNQKFEFR